MDELEVTIDGRSVGTLHRQAAGTLRFRYDAGWLDDREATPLSLSIPLRPGWFDHGTMYPYLWGLLPDNESVLERWAKDFGCSASDVFRLLENVGADVAGAARYSGTGVGPADAAESACDWVSEADVAELLRAVDRDSTAWHHGGRTGRWSLAGAQAKIALAHDHDRGWAIPRGAAPTTHILKPAIRGLEDHDINELVCLAAASRLGLRSADVSLGHFDDERALVVRRYDRTVVGDSVVRVHQEDFCQALGVHPSQKYQSDGGPSFEAMVGVVRDSGTSVDADVSRLCDAIAFNWIILGTDAHAKNYSLLLSGRTVRLAPLYDLASAAPSVDYAPKAKLAQKVGGEYQAGRISTRHWVRLAEAARVDPDALRDRVADLADALPDALTDVLTDAETGLLDTERDAGRAMVSQIASWVSRCRSEIDRAPASTPPPASARSRRPRDRRPAGTPTGGQFAPRAHSEPDDPVR